MKKYRIEWETDFCEDFPEQKGESCIMAESEEEAIEKFEKSNSMAVIMNIEEEKQ